MLYFKISYLLIFLFFKYANACLAEILLKLPEDRLINSLGNTTLDLTCVCFIDLDVLTKDDNSPYLLESTLSCLNKL